MQPTPVQPTPVQPNPMQPAVVSFSVNGEARQVTVDPRVTLADALREHLGLTGTHLGCEHGVCGACTILVDGLPARSCLMLAVQAEGTVLSTVEGLADSDGTLHPLQQAFSDRHGLQCGFCTAGMLMTALHLLATNPSPTRDEVRAELSGNICRCTGYRSITDSVMAAAEVLAAEILASRR